MNSVKGSGAKQTSLNLFINDERKTRYSLVFVYVTAFQVYLEVLCD